jgi:glutathione synthase
MRLLFVMDEVSSVKIDADTSFALMLEAQAQGHRVDHCVPADLFLVGGILHANVRRAHSQRDPHEPIALAQGEDVNLEHIDAVFVRKDPPFDSDYLWCTLMLERLRGKTLVLNDPRGLREANEKLYACHFPELMPETLVSSHRERIRGFVRQVGGRAVIKPLDGAGGSGVAVLGADDVNLKPLVGLLTAEGRRLAMVQEFQPAVVQGDKRVLLLDGHVLGTIRRVPSGGDIRANIHVGGRVERAELSAEEQVMVEAVGQRLRKVGLFFVGLDVINGKLIEINVTSPTGIQELGRLTNSVPENRVIEWVEERVKAF